MTGLRGSIVFTYDDSSCISRLIAWATGTRVSHVFILMDEKPPYLILEAWWRGVWITSMRSHLKKNVTFMAYKPKDPVGVEAGFQAAYVLLGKDYGFMQAVGCGLLHLLRRMWVRVRNPFKRGVICTEVVHYYLKGKGDAMVDGVDKNSLSPSDLMVLVSGSEKWELVPNFRTLVVLG